MVNAPSNPPSQRAPSDESERAYLAFVVGDVAFAMPPGRADEICDLGRVTSVPMAPRHLEGIISWRGRPVPLVSLASFAGLKTNYRDVSVARPDRCIVATVLGMTIAVRCEEVLGVVHGDSPPRPITVAVPAGLSLHVREEMVAGGRLLMLLDLEGFVEAARLRS
jgi:chemotaxis signal transduction protein